MMKIPQTLGEFASSYIYLDVSACLSLQLELPEPLWVSDPCFVASAPLVLLLTFKGNWLMLSRKKVLLQSVLAFLKLLIF